MNTAVFPFLFPIQKEGNVKSTPEQTMKAPEVEQNNSFTLF